MGERTSYIHGTFSWSELETNDAEAAKAFYTALFQWDYRDDPVPGGMVYSMASRDGKNVAALYRGDRQPSHWNCYVTADSTDDSAQRAAGLGASVLVEPFDVMTYGRMAVIADPTGAELCLWEPREHIGASLVNAPGSLTWNDLMTPDAGKAAEFYSGLFGWTAEEVPDGGGYRVIRNGERMNGGIMPNEDAPPSWMPYFGHEDVDGLIDEVPGLGGVVHSGPIELPQGKVAVLGDPQGAVFAAWTGGYED